MLRAYAIGFVTATAVVLLVASIWLGRGPQQELGLVWGDKVYTTKDEFKVYLKSKGLSYKVWAARYPGLAPWEPDKLTIGPITVRASDQARQDWLVRLPLAAIVLMFATTSSFLLFRRPRSMVPPEARRPVAFLSAVLTVILVGAIWVALQPRQQPGVAWGGEVFTSKAEFSERLKSTGASYETWVMRHPGAAPWERPYAGASRARRGDLLVWLLLAASGLAFATVGALVLHARLRPGRLGRGSVGPVA